VAGLFDALSRGSAQDLFVEQNFSLPPKVTKTYVEGPVVSNRGTLNHCSVWKGNLSDAMEMCDADSTCFALHDFNCNGDRWRFCSASIQALQAKGTPEPDAHACTYFVDNKAAYIDGPSVSNKAISFCSDWYGGLEDAQALCDADSACSVLHDFGCNGKHWRYCDRNIQALKKQSDSEAKACTKIADDAISYVEGPRVSNFATSSCSTWIGTKQAAQAKCNQDSNCSVIFDFDCDGQKWRYCSNLDIADAVTMGPDSAACTMVNSFVDGVKLSNLAFAGCSDWYGNLLEAQARCNADPDCSMVHDFNCDGWHWRYCVGSLDSHTSKGTDTLGCAMVKAHAVSYTDGPMVNNKAVELCSEWTGTLPEAHARCHVDPTCTSLFDWRCDGLHWRTCSGTLADMQAFSNKADSCTKIPI
jgi:hypothetical protein